MQHRAIEPRGEGGRLNQLGLAQPRSFGRRGLLRARQWDVCPLGQLANGLGKTELLVEHQELKDPAPGPAGEALEDLLGRGDIHGGAVVLVERAEADELPPPLLQGHVVADQLDDVRRLCYLLDELFGIPRQWPTRRLDAKEAFLAILWPPGPRFAPARPRLQAAQVLLKDIAPQVDRLVDETVGLGVLLPGDVPDRQASEAPGKLLSPLEKRPQRGVPDAILPGHLTDQQFRVAEDLHLVGFKLRSRLQAPDQGGVLGLVVGRLAKKVPRCAEAYAVLAAADDNPCRGRSGIAPGPAVYVDGQTQRSLLFTQVCLTDR